MTFVARDVQATITLAPNPQTNQPQVFSESGTPQATLSGSRISVRIVNSGAPAGSRAQVRIWGMTLSLMNQLCTLGMVVKLVPRNTIDITAGDLGGPLAKVFTGAIVQAYGDFNSPPDVPFHFECNSTVAYAVIPATPSSYPGATSAVTIMQGLANQMGLGFENNGVTATLPSSYYAGSAMSQVRRFARDAGINAEVIDGVLCIWPFPGARAGEAPVISALSNMVGYPAYTQQGIIVKTEYNPNIKFGGQVVVQDSILQPANGTWNVFKLDHDLDALVPGGAWLSTVYGYNPKFPNPLPPQP